MGIACRFGRRRLRGAVAVLTFASVWAADGFEAVAQQTQGSVEEIVVTGSRIRRTNLTSPTPITVLSSEEVRLTGRNNVLDIINQLPMATAVTGFTPTNTNFSVNSTGLSLVSLRNLGTKRTLTLVNGRRGVNSIFSDPDFGGYDLNLVPADLVDRVEVITGGASAVYGSDAVAGVVNVILKERFEGVRVHTQFGVSQEGDGKTYDVSSTLGSNFADNRGNFMLFAGFSRTESVPSKNRDISKTDTVRRANGTIDIGPKAFSDFTPQGVFYPADAAPQTVLADGSVVPYSKQLYGFDRNPHRLILVPQDRMLIVPRVRFDVTDDVSFFFDGTIARSKPTNHSEPIGYGLGQTVGSGPTATPILIPTNNPFIPPALRALLTPDDVAAGGFDFSKRGNEFGDRSSLVTRQVWSFVTGFQGKFANGWRWDVSYQYGKMTQDQLDLGVFNNEHLFNALNVELDPTSPGNYRCVSAQARAQGCAPVNLFGPNSVTGQALTYLSSESRYHGINTQQVAQANVTGDVVPLWAGPLAMAAGFEYRRESSKFTPDALTAAGLLSGNQTSPVSGKYDVKEGYVEAILPLLKDFDFAKALSIEGAFRLGDYSTVGTVTAWKYGGEYRPFNDLRLRTTVARAVRAPNIGELFSPASQTFPPNLNDPCDSNLDPSFFSAAQFANVHRNCAAQGVPANLAPTQADLQGITGTLGGNPHLKQETAHTWTVGMVYTPSFLPSALLSVDYYRINIRNAIRFIGGDQDTLNRCYTAAVFPNAFCSLISRKPTGIIQAVNATQENVATQRTSGIDVEAAYTIQFDDFGWRNAGSLNLKWDYTFLIKDETVPFQDAGVQKFLGQVGHSRNRWSFRATYDNGPATLSWNVRYFGKALKDNSLDFVGNQVGTIVYHDVQGRYQLGENVTLFAGVNNLANERPPFIPSPLTTNVTGTETAADVYDAIGRFFYFGVDLKF